MADSTLPEMAKVAQEVLIFDGIFKARLDYDDFVQWSLRTLASGRDLPQNRPILGPKMTHFGPKVIGFGSKFTIPHVA